MINSLRSKTVYSFIVISKFTPKKQASLLLLSFVSTYIALSSVALTLLNLYHIHFTYILTVIQILMWVLQVRSFSRMMSIGFWGVIETWPVSGQQFMLACLFRSLRVCALVFIVILTLFVNNGLETAPTVGFYFYAIFYSFVASISNLLYATSICVIYRNFQISSISLMSYLDRVFDIAILVISILYFIYNMIFVHYVRQVSIVGTHLAITARLHSRYHDTTYLLWGTTVQVFCTCISGLYVAHAARRFTYARQCEMNSIRMLHSITRGIPKCSLINLMYDKQPLVYLLYGAGLTMVIRNSKNYSNIFLVPVILAVYIFIEHILHAPYFVSAPA